MPAFDLDSYVGRSRAGDLAALDWADVPRHPVPSEMVRALRFMQDIESHTIIYLRALLATRAIDDPDVATFLACWVYEETFHGIALARFLDAAGAPVGRRPMPRGQEPLSKWIEAAATAMVSKAWPDFCAAHTAWGAINELTTLTGYRRLAAVADHPVLADLLERIILDESRHFSFYYRQPETELRFLASYLFAGPEGRAAARKVDDTIRRLPGFETVELLESWVDRHLGNRVAAMEGGGNDYRSHCASH